MVMNVFDAITLAVDRNNQDYGKACLSIVDLTGRQVYSEVLSSSTMQMDLQHISDLQGDSNV